MFSYTEKIWVSARQKAQIWTIDVRLRQNGRKKKNSRPNRKADPCETSENFHPDSAKSASYVHIIICKFEDRCVYDLTHTPRLTGWITIASTVRCSRWRRPRGDTILIRHANVQDIDYFEICQYRFEARDALKVIRVYNFHIAHIFFGYELIF